MALDTFNYNTESLAKTGNRIQDLASETIGVVNSIKNDMDSLRDCWTGRVNEELMQNIENEIEAIDADLNRYTNVGIGVSKTAEALVEMNEEIEGNIKPLKYD